MFLILFPIIFSLFPYESLCFMDMEELKSVYYGLDILKEPVSIAKVTYKHQS